MPNYKFKIKRFNPGEDKSPVSKTYNIALPRGATVLEGLIAIKSKFDGSLAFRRSCRSAICGSCACRVNGKSMLICDLQAAHVSRKGVITLEPLQNFGVIRDLVVNLDPFWKAIDKTLPWLVEGTNPPKKGYRIIPNDEFIGLGKVDVCVLCAACHSDCPVSIKHRDNPGPIFYVKTARFLLDLRDKDTGRAQRAVAAGLNPAFGRDCLNAEHGDCVVECPKGIDMERDVFKVVAKYAKKNKDNRKAEGGRPKA